MNVSERALKVLTEWNSREYRNEGQKAASLQALIEDALLEQAIEATDTIKDIIRRA